MTKQELIKEIGAKAIPKITLLQISVVLDVLADIVERELYFCDGVTLPRIGTIYAVRTAEREAKNPRTGEPVTVAAGKRIKFKALKSLKDRVNGERE